MRDGMRTDEVNKIARALRAYLEDGTAPEQAFTLACREVNGVLPKVFAGWRDEIFKMAGEPAPVATPTLTVAGFELLTSERDQLKAEVEKLMAEVEKLKGFGKEAEELRAKVAELEKLILEDDPKVGKKKS